MESRRWWLLGGLIVLLFLALLFYHFRVTVPEVKQKKAESLYREALDLEREGEFGKASKKLQEALKVLPSFKKASLRLKEVRKRIAQREAQSDEFGGSPNSSGGGSSSISPPKETASSGFKEPSDLTILLPAHYPGYERSEPIKNEYGAFCNFQPVIESDAQSIEVAIWRQKDTTEASGFIGRVSKILYPDNKKEFLFREKYPAYFGTGQLYRATYVWVVGRLVFELHAKSVKSNPAELWDDLNGLAMRFNL